MLDRFLGRDRWRVTATPRPAAMATPEPPDRDPGLRSARMAELIQRLHSLGAPQDVVDGCLNAPNPKAEAIAFIEAATQQQQQHAAPPTAADAHNAVGGSGSPRVSPMVSPVRVQAQVIGSPPSAVWGSGAASIWLQNLSSSIRELEEVVATPTPALASTPVSAPLGAVPSLAERIAAAAASPSPAVHASPAIAVAAALLPPPSASSASASPARRSSSRRRRPAPPPRAQAVTVAAADLSYGGASVRWPSAGEGLAFSAALTVGAGAGEAAPLLRGAVRAQSEEPVSSPPPPPCLLVRSGCLG
jgi:hypothetical protein